MTVLPAKVVKSNLVSIVVVLAMVTVLGVWFFSGRTPEAVNTSIFGVAIKGYDAVAYFTDGRATPGKAAFEYTWRGAKWRFASAEHRELFATQPARYAPQFGGF